MRKIFAVFILMALCFGIRGLFSAASAKPASGSYSVNHRGSVVISTDIPKAADHKYYTDQVAKLPFTTFQKRIPEYEQEAPMISIDELDSRYFCPVAASERGSVDLVTINGTDVYIYLPKGYSPDSDERYDVLFLSVANSHIAKSFMLADHRKEVFGLSASLPYRQEEMPTLIFKDYYDALGCYEDIRLIFVAVGGTTEYTYRGSAQIAAVQKYVADHYKTYAASSSDDDLTDAMYHFGILGISGGGVLATRTALLEYCDRFGYVATIDGSSSTDWDEKNANPRSVDLFFGEGPPGQRGQSSYEFSAEHYLRSFSVSHIYVEHRLGHDYLLAALGIYHILHHWFR